LRDTTVAKIRRIAEGNPFWSGGDRHRA
jgi:hypothetical protein